MSCHLSRSRKIYPQSVTTQISGYASGYASGYTEMQSWRGFYSFVTTVTTKNHLFIVSWEILHTMHKKRATHAKFYKNTVCI